MMAFGATFPLSVRLKIRMPLGSPLFATTKSFAGTRLQLYETLEDHLSIYYNPPSATRRGTVSFCC